MLNHNLPLWSPRFRQNEVTFDLEYKPFPRYPTWLVAWSMSWLVDVFASYDALLLDMASDIEAIALDVTAAVGIAGDAEAAAAAALAASGNAKTHQFSFMGDELVYSVGTPARTINASYPYNFGVLTNAVPAGAERPFRADAGTWTIYIHVFKGANAGTLSFSITGGWGVTFEAYQPANTFTHLQVYTGVTLTGDSERVFSVSCGTHHASSTGYVMLVWKVYGFRTGA